MNLITSTNLTFEFDFYYDKYISVVLSVLKIYKVKK